MEEIINKIVLDLGDNMDTNYGDVDFKYLKKLITNGFKEYIKATNFSKTDSIISINEKGFRYKKNN